LTLLPPQINSTKSPPTKGIAENKLVITVAPHFDFCKALNFKNITY